jgi:hypothetical protein
MTKAERRVLEFLDSWKGYSGHWCPAVVLRREIPESRGMMARLVREKKVAKSNSVYGLHYAIEAGSRDAGREEASK